MMAERRFLFDIAAFHATRALKQPVIISSRIPAVNRKIRIYRITYLKIAEMLGWHFGTVANLLMQARRNTPLPISKICALAWALNVEPAVFIKPEESSSET